MTLPVCAAQYLAPVAVQQPAASAERRLRALLPFLSRHSIPCRVCQQNHVGWPSTVRERLSLNRAMQQSNSPGLAGATASMQSL